MLKNGLESEVAEVLVEAVNLEMDPAEIDPTEPLFGDRGLGLDSIDALELALAVSVKYGVQIRSDDDQHREALQSLQSLTNYIEAHRQS